MILIFIFVICAILIIYLLFLIARLSLHHRNHESFDGTISASAFDDDSVDDAWKIKPNYKQVLLKSSSAIYDSFYATVYQKMVSDYKKTLCEYEVNELCGHIGKEARILDIGCGTGDHLTLLYQKGYDVVGLDHSEFMLKIAEKKLQAVKKQGTNSFQLTQGDMTTTSLFPAKRFDVCICFYFSFYYASSRNISVNVKTWLRKGGIFAVHLVDPEKFDPILDAANPFAGFSLKKYLKTNISKIVFSDMLYKSSFHYQDKEGTFQEQFVIPSKNLVRRHHHTLTMLNLQDSVDVICSNGFKYSAHSKLEQRGYDHQYIFYFERI